MRYFSGSPDDINNSESISIQENMDMDDPAFCPECGAPSRGKDPFCTNCGEPLRPDGPPSNGPSRTMPKVQRVLFLLATILGAVAIVLLTVSFVSDWYEFESESNTDKAVIFEDLGGWEIQSTDKTQGTTDRTSRDWNGTLETGDLYLEMNPVLLSSLTVLVIGVIVSAFTPYSANPGKAGFASLVLLLVAGLLILGSSLYYMDEHPDTYARNEAFGELREDEGPWDSFSGTEGEGLPRSTWGPRNGWFAALFSGVLAMGSALLCVSAMYLAWRDRDADIPRRIPDRVVRERMDDEPTEEEVRMPGREPDRAPPRYGEARGAPPPGWTPGTTPPGDEKGADEFEDFPVYGSGRKDAPDGKGGMGYDDGPHPDVYRAPFDDRGMDDDPYGDDAEDQYLPPTDDRYGDLDDGPLPEDGSGDEAGSGDTAERPKERADHEEWS